MKFWDQQSLAWCSCHNNIKDLFWLLFKHWNFNTCRQNINKLGFTPVTSLNSACILTNWTVSSWYIPLQQQFKPQFAPRRRDWNFNRLAYLFCFLAYIGRHFCSLYWYNKEPRFHVIEFATSHHLCISLNGNENKQLISCAKKITFTKQERQRSVHNIRMNLEF